MSFKKSCDSFVFIESSCSLMSAKTEVKKIGTLFYYDKEEKEEQWAGGPKYVGCLWAQYSTKCNNKAMNSTFHALVRQ